MEAKRIGFIGLGNIGKPMAKNLLTAGFDLTVHDLRQAPLDELEQLGASVASAPAEIGQRCDITCVVVVDDAQVEAVIAGPGGLLESAKPGSIIVIHSTVHPRTCRNLAEQAAKHEVDLLDAALSGGEEGAMAGSLTLMVGADAQVLAACQPVFEVVAEHVFHLGGLGMGQAGKLANNLMCLVNYVSTYEGMRFGVAAGIDPETLLQMVKVSTGDSWVVQHWAWFEKLRREYTTGLEGLGEVMYKDLALALEVAHELKVPLRAAALSSQMVDEVLGIGSTS